MKCLLSSEEKTLTFSHLEGVTLPALWGELELLPGHAELFLLLREGEARLLEKSGRIRTLKLAGGAAHFKDDLLTIIL